MPKPPLPAEIQKFLSKPNPAVIGTVTPSGAPHTTATWYMWDNGRLLVNMDEERKRLDYLRRDRRVSLTVLDGDDWYSHVTLSGHVAEMYDETDLADIDRISRHYRGTPYSDRERGRVSAWIEVESWHGWGAFRTRAAA